MRLKERVALVTGSSQGLGRAIAVRFAQEGADVVINYVGNADRAKETLAEVEAAGARGLVIEADVSSVGEVRRMVADTVNRLGHLDILVNNAGIEQRAPFWEMTEEDFDRVMAVNVKGVVFATQAVVQHLRETGRRGKIINVSSVHEELPFPNFTSYCASKGAVKMVTRNLSIELAPLGITVNAIAPGAFETPINMNLLNNKELLAMVLKQIPLGRLGKPEEVAGLAAFLASPEADYITGTTYFIDGGLTWNYSEQ